MLGSLLCLIGGIRFSRWVRKDDRKVSIGVKVGRLIRKCEGVEGCSCGGNNESGKMSGMRIKSKFLILVNFWVKDVYWDWGCGGGFGIVVVVKELYVL